MILSRCRFLVAAAALTGFALVSPLQANAHCRGYYDHCDGPGYCAGAQGYRYDDARREANRYDRDRALNETEREELQRYREQACRNGDRPYCRGGHHHGW